MTPPFYTVIESDTLMRTPRFFIRYVRPPYWSIQEFPDDKEAHGGYFDPGEATREFKKYQCFKQAEYVSKNEFERRIRAHEQDLELLRSWTQPAYVTRSVQG